MDGQRMTDRHLIFSAAMVRALFNGSKTQTRRAFKPHGFEFVTHPISGDRYNEYQPYRDGSWDESLLSGSGQMRAFGYGEELYAYLPWKPSDRIWVKETWRVHECYNDLKPSELGGEETVWYEANGETCDWGGHGGIILGRVRQSNHMPRWASRITLLVTDVRVQRLQDITEADAVAEGIIECHEGFAVDRQGSCWGPTARRSYALLWHSINFPGSWEANPWVTATTFDVVKQNIGEL